MFTKEVTDKDGVTRLYVAETQKELDQAIKDYASQVTPEQPDINVPVEKGFDLTETTPEFGTVLVDGSTPDAVTPPAPVEPTVAPVDSTPTPDVAPVEPATPVVDTPPVTPAA